MLRTHLRLKKQKQGKVGMQVNGSSKTGDSQRFVGFAGTAFEIVGRFALVAVADLCMAHLERERFSRSENARVDHAANQRVVEKVGVVQARGEITKCGWDRGFAETLVLGGELFEDGVEGERLVVVHRDADGADCGAVGAEEGHDWDPGIGDLGGRMEDNGKAGLLKKPSKAKSNGQIDDELE